MRSGFVSLVGRPNVGKSSILNAACGRKVSIVSDKPQTTRTRVRAIVHRTDSQIVFVDTPGIHKPVSELGKRVNATALDASREVDITCLVVDATMPFGRGDQFVAERMNLTTGAVIATLERVMCSRSEKNIRRSPASDTLPALAMAER